MSIIGRKLGKCAMTKSIMSKFWSIIDSSLVIMHTELYTIKPVIQCTHLSQLSKKTLTSLLFVITLFNGLH